MYAGRECAALLFSSLRGGVVVEVGWRWLGLTDTFFGGAEDRKMESVQERCVHKAARQADCTL